MRAGPPPSSSRRPAVPHAGMPRGYRCTEPAWAPVCVAARIGYSSDRTPGTVPAGSRTGVSRNADVAQLVEHHLAKVRVAGSNPVVRSETPNAVGDDRTALRDLIAGLHLRRPPGPPAGRPCGGVAEWLRQGPAKPCTRVRFPSPPHTIPGG